jgi:hypothetical protein
VVVCPKQFLFLKQQRIFSCLGEQGQCWGVPFRPIVPHSESPALCHFAWRTGPHAWQHHRWEKREFLLSLMTGNYLGNLLK